MSSFSCPHLETENTFCIKLNVDCIPGRKGCVLGKKYVFAIPAEERIKNSTPSLKEKIILTAKNS